MKSVEETYAEIISKLRTGEAFRMSRFGDGEWSCIFGDPGHNCDGHEYFPDLGEKLKAIVQSRPGYLVGLQEAALRSKYGEQIVELISPLELEWFNADVLHKMSIYGRLRDFIRVLTAHRWILAGPKYLMGLPFKPRHHILISEKNCWLEYENVKSMLDAFIEPGDIVILCASMMANVLVDEAKELESTWIDVGSLLDPYAGRFTRAYHKKLEL